MREEQIKQKLTSMLQTFNEIPCKNVEDYVLLRKQAIEELEAEGCVQIQEIPKQTLSSIPAQPAPQKLIGKTYRDLQEAAKSLQEDPVQQQTVTNDQQPAGTKQRSKYEALRNINDGWN